MVHIGNDWDELLKDEFQKEYYLRLRRFLAYEYKHHTVYPDMYDIFNALRYTAYADVKVVRLVRTLIMDKDRLTGFVSPYRKVSHLLPLCKIFMQSCIVM